MKPQLKLSFWNTGNDKQVTQQFSALSSTDRALRDIKTPLAVDDENNVSGNIRTGNENILPTDPEVSSNNLALGKQSHAEVRDNNLSLGEELHAKVSSKDPSLETYADNNLSFGEQIYTEVSSRNPSLKDRHNVLNTESHAIPKGSEPEVVTVRQLRSASQFTMAI